MQKQTISLKQLKQICDEYDKVNGIYPESQKEGKAVYEFITKKINPKNKYTRPKYKTEERNELRCNNCDKLIGTYKGYVLTDITLCEDCN